MFHIQRIIDIIIIMNIIEMMLQDIITKDMAMNMAILIIIPTGMDQDIKKMIIHFSAGAAQT